MRWDRNINKQLWRSKSGPTGSYMIHSDTSSLFLHCEGPPFMFYILPVSVADWIQRYLLACFFNTPGLRCFWMKSFQTCHSTLPLNTRLINVAHTLIIHVKDFFLLGVSNCQEPREPLPPPLFDGRSLPLGKALLCRRWRTRSEGQETKERLGCPLWPPSPQLERVQTHSLPIWAIRFFTSELHLSNPSSPLLTFPSFSVHHPLLWLFNHKRLAASGIKPQRDVWAWRKMDG